MIMALTLIPVLVSFAYNRTISNPDKSFKEPGNFILIFIEKKYSSILNKLLKHYKETVVTGFSIVILILSLGFFLGIEFLPSLDEGSIFLRGNFPAGITIQENAKYAPRIRNIISRYPQIAFVITQTGRNDDGTDPFPSNRNEILVGLKDYRLWSDTISKKKLIKLIKADLEGELPSVHFSTGQPIIDMVLEIVNGSAADLAVSLVGDDLILMRNKADSISGIIKSMRGSESVNIEQEGTQEQLAIKINRQYAARYGINVSDIQNMVEVAIGGKPISVLYDGTKRYDIILRYLPQFRNNIDEIKNLLVPSASGSLIPMSQLADIHFIEGQTNIYRYNNKRMITVRTDIRDRDQGGFVNELKGLIEKKVAIPKGYELVFGGQYENLQRAGKQLALTIPLTLIIVFAFLFLLFKNFKDTLITGSCILFAIAGGIGALLIRGYYFNVSAGVGFISIFGVSIMAGVLFVSSFKRAALNDSLGINIVSSAAKEQIRAVISILILAILGLIPAAISTGIGSDVQRPLATVIIGGLTSTLIFAPLLIPPLYWWAKKSFNQNA
jgi:cobalt-zinc-cadmium resistance protein CzcA